MTKWLEEHKNSVLIVVLILFILLSLFFFFLIRPLAAEEEAKKQELNRIQSDVAFYQNHLDELAPQTFTEQEKEDLLGKVPTLPNVEEVVKELEKAEIETGAVIDNITISDHPNELGPKALQENEDSEANSETQENTETTQQPGTTIWSHILPEETLKSLEEKEKLAHVNKLTVSYIELAIDVNGEEEDVHQFLETIEKFKRIIHVQSYDYTINEENDRLEGVLTIRAFYSNDFEELINGKNEFKLDYNFDPSKIKRYIEPETTEVETGTVNNSETPLTGSVSNNNSDGYSNPSGNTIPRVEELPPTRTPSETNPSGGKKQNKSSINPDTKLYSAPPIKREGEPVFLVVQTGAYNENANLNSAVQELVDSGVYPRIIGNDLFYVYTATDSSDDSAQKIVDLLKSKGFDSYVKTLPYRLTTVEKDVLLVAADELVGTTTEILTNNITNGDIIKDEQLDAIRTKIKVYDSKIQELMNKGVSEDRKRELQETLSISTQLDQVLQNNQKDGNRESLWEAEGLLLDFMLILNRYVPADIN